MTTGTRAFVGRGVNMMTPDVEYRRQSGGLAVELATGTGIPAGFGGTGPRIWGVTVLVRVAREWVPDDERSRCFADHDDPWPWDERYAGANYREASDYADALLRESV